MTLEANSSRHTVITKMREQNILIVSITFKHFMFNCIEEYFPRNNNFHLTKYEYRKFHPRVCKELIFYLLLLIGFLKFLISSFQLLTDREDKHYVQGEESGSLAQGLSSFFFFFIVCRVG